MRVVSNKVLREHWQKPSRQDSEQPLRKWFRYAKRASWQTPADIKAEYRSVSFVGERVVFNIAGNKYRLVVWINSPYGVVYVCFVGTHAEYDRIDVETV